MTYILCMQSGKETEISQVEKDALYSFIREQKTLPAFFEVKNTDGDIALVNIALIEVVEEKKDSVSVAKLPSQENMDKPLFSTN